MSIALRQAGFSEEEQRLFYSRTKRPSHIRNTDQALETVAQGEPDFQNGLNGAMFSSRWLADDMGLQDRDKVKRLRSLVDQAHGPHGSFPGFGEGSPSDWWAIVLADGDGMGQYISSRKLKLYKEYLVEAAIAADVDLGQLNVFQEATHKRMGPATHVGLNRALLDFSNRLVPHLTEDRYCGRVIYSGGDDVMAVLPIEDLPEYLLSLKAAWCGGEDPQRQFQSHNSGYWHPPEQALNGIPRRPLFTMGAGATMSMGVVIAHKSIPLPTVLEHLWTAEGDRAKRLYQKDGLCFRVIYSSGNTLEAVMKGNLLTSWWRWVEQAMQQYAARGDNLTPVLYRLSEELPRRADLSEHHLFSKAAKVLMERRDEQLESFEPIGQWIDDWEDWARRSRRDFRDEVVRYGKPASKAGELAEKLLGTQPDDLGALLRFTAFWLDKRLERLDWTNSSVPNQEAA